MMFRNCSFEEELAQALKDGHWPDGCGRELRSHVESCGKCSDLVLVTQTFQSARSESERAGQFGPFNSPIDSPSLLWWRAQLRRRNAAAQRVGRPITIAQAFAWLVVGLVSVVFVVSQSHEGLRWAAWWAEFMPQRALHVTPAVSAAPDWNVLLLLSGLVLVLLSGVVVYLASDKS